MPYPGIDRRTLLRLAAAAACATWLPRAAMGQPRLADSPFRLGVASGSPDDGSVVLWTRLINDALPAAAVPVAWEIAQDERFSRIVASGQATALPELAHSVHVEAGGLAPDGRYFYRFHAAGHTSATGSTRTLPAADANVAKLRIAYASCQRWEHGYFTAWRHMLADAPDLVVFLGDYIYEYPGAATPVRTPTGGWVATLDDYRARYALYKGDAPLQAMHAACPWFFTWDDHEVQNDYAGVHPGNAGPIVADFAARRAAAYQAWYEHTPVRASVLTRALAGLPQGAEMRIHGRRRIGRLADLYLLDARQYRDAQACTRGGRAGSSNIDPRSCDTLADPKRTMLGAAQEAWLDEALSRGSGGWNLVAQSTLFAPREFATAAGRMVWNDGWDGYPAGRERLVASLQRHAVANPVLLGGDVHENWVGHVKKDFTRPDSPNVAVEFCGTSITSRASDPARTPQILANNPHFVFADAAKRGYGIADLTPARMEVSLRAIDAIDREDSGVSTLARFAVEAGRAKVEKA